MENKFKISSKSNPNSVAGAIASALQEFSKVEITGIGAGAVNQMCKSVAIARGFLAPSGQSVVCIPLFCETIVDGEEKTGIKMVVKLEEV